MFPEFFVTIGGVKVKVTQYYAVVPGISIHNDTIPHLAGSTGLNRKQLEEDTQAVLYRGWAYNLKWFIRYWVRWYYKQFPDLIKEDGTMAGFDASVLARYFWPGEAHGGAKKQYLREELRQWAVKAREIQSPTPD